MFAKAARNFLRDIDAGGELISVSSLNDSDKAQLLAMVVKKKRFWFWQKPKYEFPSCVCLLGNVLTEEEPVNPVVVESEFVKYEEKCDDVKLGAVDAGFVTVQGNIGGTEKIESRSSFGTLRKQEVDMQHLMKDVQDRKINLDHPFIQQLHENKNDILCVIKERIVTTQECVISQQTQISETCTLGAKGKTVTASVTEGGNFKDENTVLEIPTNTAVAYGVVELSVKQDGCFEFCFLSEKQGGFDKESSEKFLVTPSGAHDARSLSEFDVVDEKPVPSNASLADANQEVCLPSEKLDGFEKESSEKVPVTHSGADDARSLSEFDVADGFRDVSVDEKPVPSNASQADLNQEVCLPSEKQGGFEKESSEKIPVTQSGAHDARSLSEFDVVDGFRDVSLDEKPVPSNASLADLNQDILELTKQFALLQELPDSLREELYNLLCEILDDGQTLAQIQAVVEEICLGSKPGLTFLNELKLPQKEYAQKILSLVGYDLQDKKLTEQSKDLIAAFHILTSALDEMPDSALTILGACCQLHLLPALCALPNITSDEGLCSRTEPLLSDLIDQGTFQIVQRLFSLSNMSLEMNEKNMRAETFTDPGFLPLILYIVLSGFHSLVKKN